MPRPRLLPALAALAPLAAGCAPAFSPAGAPAAPRLAASGAAAADPYGGPPPGAPAVRFAPGVVSNGDEFSAAFTPDGREVVVTRRNRGRPGGPALVVSRFEGGRWAPAAPAEFARGHPSADPFVTRDGRRLFFSWGKPRPGMRADTTADYDTWVAERTAGGGWGEPRHLGDAPHSTASDMYPSVTRAGALYFDSMRPGLPSRRNVWRAAPAAAGAYGPAAPLPPAVNDSAAGASNPYVDPDERYVIFSSARAGGLGRSDLWVAYRRADGTWGPAQNLGPRVNSADVEFCPTVSPDGRWLLFSRIRYDGERQAADDIYVVGADALPPPAP